MPLRLLERYPGQRPGITQEGRFPGKCDPSRHCADRRRERSCWPWHSSRPVHASLPKPRSLPAPPSRRATRAVEKAAERGTDEAATGVAETAGATEVTGAAKATVVIGAATGGKAVVAVMAVPPVTPEETRAVPAEDRAAPPAARPKAGIPGRPVPEAAVEGAGRRLRPVVGATLDLRPVAEARAVETRAAAAASASAIRRQRGPRWNGWPPAGEAAGSAVSRTACCPGYRWSPY
jgi:hypothetical protein